MYSDLHRELEIQKAAMVPSQDTKNTILEETSAERSTIDPELMKSERRKRAALFLNQMKKDKAAGKSFSMT